MPLHAKVTVSGGTLDEGAVNCVRCEGEGGSAWKERVRDEYIIGLEEGVCGFDVVLQGCWFLFVA